MQASHTAAQATEISRIFALQLEHQQIVAETTVQQRIDKLKRLLNIVMVYQDKMRAAMEADFQKPPIEVDLTELYLITSEIKYIIRNLRKWMRPKRVGVPLAFVGASSWVQYEPKGVCLILSPWNFPFMLTIRPLASAIAAGNTVIIKPSEISHHSTQLMAEMMAETFPEEEVALFQGGVDTATQLLELPFNHIYFTGSPQVGKIVMKAAAQHLASVTLELGGQNPTIIDETADLKTIAGRLIWGKFANTGQVCAAPDHVYVHEKIAPKLKEILAKQLADFYGTDFKSSPDFGRVISDRHFARLNDALQDTIAQGARAFVGGQVDAENRFIAPTLLENVAEDSALMQAEIFGPILPIMTYASLDEVIQHINRRERPLALYIYSRSRRNTTKILKGTRAGTTAINNNTVHYYNHHMPFGGVNNSGVGKAHGWYAFEAFSNARGIYKQNLPSGLALLMPPYTDLKLKLAQLTIKWL